MRSPSVGAHGCTMERDWPGFLFCFINFHWPGNVFQEHKRSSPLIRSLIFKSQYISLFSPSFLVGLMLDKDGERLPLIHSFKPG